MYSMSTPYEQQGRTDQKRRTREALVDAARALVAQGLAPTVEEAAEAASISRTTAYRYFPNKLSLLMAAHPETGAVSLLPADAPHDPAARLDAVVIAFTTMILDTEPQQRTMLRLSLEPDERERGALPLRQGRAIAWITEALEGVQHELGEDEMRRLVLSIRATIGIESLVWLIDIARLERGEAVELMRWSAQALLAKARSDVATPRAGPTKRSRH